MIDFGLKVDGFRATVGGVIPRRFCYVKRNYEWSGVSRPTLNGARPKVHGLPDTVKLIYPDPVPLDSDAQWFWIEQLRVMRPEWSLPELINAWRSLTVDGRAFTDRVSWSNGYADYVQRLNLDAAPMKITPITCGGAVHEIIEGPIHEGGKLAYKIITLDAEQIKGGDAGQLNRHTNPELVFAATISRREGLQVDGSWLREDLEIPFPQLQGVSVPVPLFSKGGVNYIEAARVRELPPGDSFPNPYNPPLYV